MNITKTQLSYIAHVPLISDEASLCVVEGSHHIPFAIKRFYYILDVDPGAVRGMHAHKKNEQMMFCIRGSVCVVLDNGLKREKIILDKPNQGLFLDAMMWHEMHSFQKDTILLVAASDYFSESDYIRDYQEYKSLVNK